MRRPRPRLDRLCHRCYFDIKGGSAIPDARENTHPLRRGAKDRDKAKDKDREKAEGARARSEVRAQGRRWEDGLGDLAEAARAALKQADPQEVARKSSAAFQALDEGGGSLSLRLLGREYRVSIPEWVVYETEGGRQAHPAVQAMVLTYLRMADGTPLLGRWVSLREIPGGAFYERAFQGYTGNRLVQAFKNDLEALKGAGAPLQAEPLSLGDASFRVWALPRVPLAVVYWRGDEEFAPNARVLFDASADHYQPVDGLAVLGRMLCDRLIALKAERRP